jgi:hypothetical protein
LDFFLLFAMHVQEDCLVISLESFLLKDGVGSARWRCSVRVRAEIKTWATCVQGSEQPGECREDHATKGVKQCTMVLGGARWSMIAVEAFG